MNSRLKRNVIAAVVCSALSVGVLPLAYIGTSSDTLSSYDVAAKCKKKDKKKKKCKKSPSPQPTETSSASPPSSDPPSGGSGEFVPGRVVEMTYSGPTIGTSDAGGVNIFSLVDSLEFTPGPGETRIMVVVDDAVSPTAPVSFSYDSDGDGISDTGPDICGATTEPVEVIPGNNYAGFAWLLPSTTCQGFATSGTITVTFNKV